MNTEETLQFTEDLIRIPSLSGQEHEAANFLVSHFERWGWEVERLPVSDGRDNLLVSFGEPEILFTTHFDVVPAPEEMFQPRWEGEKLVGRGACDAKGILASMLAAGKQLKDEESAENFGFLFVVGEETGGDGARAAAKDLKGRVKYIINGEPTEGQIYTAHKGVLGIELTFTGKSCHSGYPELGDDANAKLFRTAVAILGADLGEDPELGRATVNMGRVDGGVAMNVVSPKAELTILVRTVTDHEPVIEKLKTICHEASDFSVHHSNPLAKMVEVPGFEKGIASYCTDIPNFRELGAEAVLYGPGTIHVAHTDEEFITKDMVAGSIDGYKEIFKYLQSQA